MAGPKHGRLAHRAALAEAEPRDNRAIDLGDRADNPLENASVHINDRGQVVGWAWDGFAERAFLWDNGIVTMLDDPSVFTFAKAINNTDPVQIIGSGSLFWTVLSDGTVLKEDLPTLTGFGTDGLSNLNDRGEVVGDASTGQKSHAILWTFNPETSERVAVDLGVGVAQIVDNSASLVGLTRVVGYVDVVSGKGKKKTTTRTALLWEVEPIQ